MARLQARIYAESGPYAANDAVKLLRRLLAQADQWVQQELVERVAAAIQDYES